MRALGLIMNIPTVVGITCRGHGCKCGIHVWLIVIYVRVGTKYFCSRGRICEGT